MIPLRSGALEDVLEIVDITNFLTAGVCTDCAKIQSVEINTDENIVVKIGIKHPFNYGDAGKPITGKNRADLHVFNVEGIIISDGVEGSLQEYTELLEVIGGYNLITADGYTKYLKESLLNIYPTIATLHPYVLHFDDYSVGNFDPLNPFGFESVTFPTPSGNLVMPMGSDYDYQDYEFTDIPLDESMDFIFAIGCTYGVSSALKAMRFAPEYRVPQHLKKAASEVEVEIFQSELISPIDTSEATLHIKVLDPSHGVTVGTALNEMLADSSVAQIFIDLPTVLLQPKDISSPVPISGSGNDPLDPLTFEVVINNEGLADPGFYTGLVKVLDSYPPGLNTAIILDGMDGIHRVGPIENPLNGFFDIDEFATYQTFTVEVEPGAPECDVVAVPDSVAQGETILFDGSLSTSYSDIINYEWDFDYSGVEAEFDMDMEGATLDTVTRAVCDAGDFIVGLKLTDTLNLTAICSATYTVTLDTSDIAGWGVDIEIYPPDQGSDTNSCGYRAIEVWGDDIYTVWYTWGNGGYGNSQVYFSRSEDRGQTWGIAVDVSQHTNNQVQPFPVIRLDKNNGDLYVGWPCSNSSAPYNTNGTDVASKRSSDRGDTWSDPVIVAGGSGGQDWTAIEIDSSVDPAIIHFSYAQDTTDVFVATNTSAGYGVTPFNITQVDGGPGGGSTFTDLEIHPLDGSLHVVWSASKYYGGHTDGNVMFNRSTDGGQTFTGEVVAHSDPANVQGPYNGVIAISPATGIPGILWRDLPGSTWYHRFKTADDTIGSSWGTVTDHVEISSGGSFNVWAGALDAGKAHPTDPQTHWVAVTMNAYQALFSQLNEASGSSWTPTINVADDTVVYNPYIEMDDCKNVYIIWSDVRPPYPTEPSMMYFDWGT